MASSSSAEKSLKVKAGATFGRESTATGSQLYPRGRSIFDRSRYAAKRRRSLSTSAACERNFSTNFLVVSLAGRGPNFCSEYAKTAVLPYSRHPVFIVPSLIL